MVFEHHGTDQLVVAAILFAELEGQLMVESQAPEHICLAEEPPKEGQRTVTVLVR